MTQPSANNTTQDSSNRSGIIPPPLDYNYFSEYESLDGSEDEYIHPFNVPHIKGIFIFLYSIVFACCFFGNLLVILVILRHQKMRTVTNFFLANLAVADFFVGVFCVLPNLMQNLSPNWVLGNIMCKLYYFVQALSYTASISILTVMSIERFIAIIYPMKSKSWTTLNRMRAVVVGVWIIAGGCGAPYLYFYGTITIVSPDDVLTFCMQVNDFNMPAFVTCNFLLFYIMPLILMTVLYTKISIVLWRTSKQGSIEQTMFSGREKSKSSRNPLLRKGIRLVVFSSKRRQEKDKEYNSVPNIIVISAAPVASRENSPLGIRKPLRNQAIQHHQNVRSEVRVGRYTSKPKQEEQIDSNFDGKIRSSNDIECEYEFVHDPPSDEEILSNSSQPIGQSWNNACTGTSTATWTQPKSTIDSPSHNAVVKFKQPVDNTTKTKHQPPQQQQQQSQQQTLNTQVIRTSSKGSTGGEPKRKEGALLARRKVIRLLMAVLISFSICVFPYHLRVMYQTWSKPEISFGAMLMVPITFVVYYTNSGLNPILYAFLSDNFRKSLKEVLTCKVSKQGRTAYCTTSGGSLKTVNTSL